MKNVINIDGSNYILESDIVITKENLRTSMESGDLSLDDVKSVLKGYLEITFEFKTEVSVSDIVTKKSDFEDMMLLKLVSSY